MGHTLSHPRICLRFAGTGTDSPQVHCFLRKAANEVLMTVRPDTFVEVGAGLSGMSEASHRAEQGVLAGATQVEP